MNNESERPPSQTFHDITPNPSLGTGEPYSHEFRQFVMSVRNLGLSNHAIFEDHRHQHLYPSLRTERRWDLFERLYGTYRACKRSGNNRATVLRDYNLFYLAFYRVAFPKATAAEINAFLYRVNYGAWNFRFYSCSQITKAEDRIQLTRKRGSTTAWHALRPINQAKRWVYWNMPYPYGIADIRREDLIDLDECGICFITADRHIGKAVIGERVKQAGNYQKGEKYNLLLAVSGSVQAERWAHIWLVGGTTNDRMIDFIQDILNDIGPGSPQRRRCFIMDNLNSHHSRQMAALIYNGTFSSSCFAIISLSYYHTKYVSSSWT